MVGRSVKSKVARRGSAQRHTEGLDSAIEIHVIDRVLVVPDAGRGIRYLVSNESSAIDSRLGLDRIDGRSSPGIDRRGRSHRGSNRRKAETGRAADTEATVGRIVVHVALPRVTLAPGVLVWSNICRLGKIGGTRIGWRVQIVGLNNNPVGHTVVHVPGMIVRRGRRISPREKAGERVDPSARSQIWPRIETGRIRVRASRA